MQFFQNFGQKVNKNVIFYLNNMVHIIEEIEENLIICLVLNPLKK